MSEPNNSKPYKLGTFDPTIKTSLATIAVYFAMKDYVEEKGLNPDSFEVSASQIDIIVREWLKKPTSLGVLRENSPHLLPDDFSAELSKLEKEYAPRPISESIPIISQLGKPKFMTELDEIIARVQSPGPVAETEDGSPNQPDVQQYPLPSPFGPEHTDLLKHLVQFHQIEVEMAAKILFAMTHGNDQAQPTSAGEAQRFRVIAAAVLAYGLIVQGNLPPDAQCTAPEG